MFDKSDFMLENHEVITEDGYILSLQRINYCGNRNASQELDSRDSGLNKDDLEKQEKKTPVLFIHGFVASAEIWCSNSLDKCLPYEIAVKEKDCWLANLRGTRLSNRHVSLNESNPKYWDFSMHELGLFDVPAMINYILDVTAQPSLQCICHSMGASVLLLALSLLPNMNGKVRNFIAIAPAVYGKYMPSRSAKIGMAIGTNFMGKNERIYRRPTLQLSSKEIGEKCRIPFLSSERIGLWVLRRIGSLGGFGNFTYIENERMTNLASIFPACSSVKVFVHGSQWAKADKAIQFDYGDAENIRRYGQKTPPEYNFQLVTAPITILYTDDDQLCHPQDIKRLADELPNLVDLIKVTCPGFSHMDFLVGNNSVELVHNKIIDVVCMKNKN